MKPHVAWAACGNRSRNEEYQVFEDTAIHYSFPPENFKRPVENS